MQTRSLLVLLPLAAAALGACGDDAASPPTTPAAAGAATVAAAPPVEIGATELGDVLVDEAGLSLYGFTNDSDGVSSCYDDCATTWPPLLVDGPDVPGGLDPGVYSVSARDDGTFQLVAGDWPLYYFAADAAPGDVNGQGVGGIWWLVDAAGELVEAAPAGIAGTGSPSTDRDDGYSYDY